MFNPANLSMFTVYMKYVLVSCIVYVSICMAPMALILSHYYVLNFSAFTALHNCYYIHVISVITHLYRFWWSTRLITHSMSFWLQSWCKWVVATSLMTRLYAHKIYYEWIILLLQDNRTCIVWINNSYLVHLILTVINYYFSVSQCPRITSVKFLSASISQSVVLPDYQK